MPLDLDARNSFETRNILVTFQTTKRFILELGEFPTYDHSGRIDKHFYLTEILLSAIALESYVYGMSKHYSVPLPSSMPNPDRLNRTTKPKIGASLEYKLNSYMMEAKKRIKFLRMYDEEKADSYKVLPREVKKMIIKEFNNSFKQVKLGLKVRNKLAHGETFNALNGSKKKKKNKLSKFIREINKEQSDKLVSGIEKFKNLCDALFMFNEGSSEQNGFHQFWTVARLLNRNDFLAKIGKKSPRNEPSNFPAGFEDVAWMFVVRRASLLQPKVKKIFGMTRKFLKNNGYKIKGREITEEQVQSFLVEKYWNPLRLSEIFSIHKELAAELYFCGINTSPANSILLFQKTLNDLSIATGKKVRISETGIVDDPTIALTKKLSRYQKIIIRSFLVRQINYYYSLSPSKPSIEMAFKIGDRLLHNTKNKVIDHSLF